MTAPFTFLLLGVLSTALSAESALSKAASKSQQASHEAAATFTHKAHAQGATEIANQQDELSADVQELLQEETNEKVVKLLREAEDLMLETTDRLARADTSGETIVLPTEIIEKISQAAKERNKNSKNGNSALMQMLQQMMQQGQGKQPAPRPSSQNGQQAGEGGSGSSDTANSAASGKSKGNTEQRRLPKSSGSTGTSMPKEFHKALEAYNKALQPR